MALTRQWLAVAHPTFVAAAVPAVTPVLDVAGGVDRFDAVAALRAVGDARRLRALAELVWFVAGVVGLNREPIVRRSTAPLSSGRPLTGAEQADVMALRDRLLIAAQDVPVDAAMESDCRRTLKNFQDPLTPPTRAGGALLLARSG